MMQVEKESSLSARLHTSQRSGIQPIPTCMSGTEQGPERGSNRTMRVVTLIRSVDLASLREAVLPGNFPNKDGYFFVKTLQRNG